MKKGNYHIVHVVYVPTVLRLPARSSKKYDKILQVASLYFQTLWYFQTKKENQLK